jgi:RIO-like serine/threonine protein kinase
VVRLSKENITDEIEVKVLEAFSVIHALGVRHNDVRGDNILIGDGGSRVWIIDFEDSTLLADYEDSDYGAPSEIDSVKRLFSAIKNGERW